MTRDAWPAWPDRVVARFPTLPREGLLLFPLGPLAVVIPNASTITDLHDLLLWCLVGLMGALAGWIYITLFSRLLLALYGRMTSALARAIWVVAAGGGTGVAFALGVTMGISVLDLPNAEPLWWRITATGIIIGWFGITLTLALDARDRLRRERDTLIEEAIALEAARLTTTAIIDEMREEVAHDVERALAAARGDLDQNVGDTRTSPDIRQWQEVAATLRTTASDTVRPLSRDLWESASRNLQRPRPWSLMTYVIGHQPLRPLAVSVIYVLGVVSTLVQQVNAVPAAVELAAGVAIIAIVMALANAIMRRSPRYHALVFIAAALFLQIFAVLNSLRLDRQSSNASLAGVIASVVAGLIIILATSSFGAVRSITQQQLDAISAEVDQTFVESTARSQALAEVLREASAVMHGSVQSRLLGCAMAIEDAGRSRDAEQFSLALARARTELENPLPLLSRPAAASLLDELERRRDLWEGLCDVVYEISPGIPELPSTTVTTCGRIVEEGISNATRHGEAQRVVIHVELPGVPDIRPTALRITVTDDGRGVPDTHLTAGLGLRMIGSVATAWSLTNVDGHGCLTVDLPVN